MTNFQSFLKRIAKAETAADCDKLDDSLDRLYKVGVFTVNQIGKLDGHICDKRHTLKAIHS